MFESCHFKKPQPDIKTILQKCSYALRSQIKNCFRTSSVLPELGLPGSICNRAVAAETFVHPTAPVEVQLLLNSERAPSYFFSASGMAPGRRLFRSDCGSMIFLLKKIPSDFDLPDPISVCLSLASKLCQAPSDEQNFHIQPLDWNWCLVGAARSCP